MKTKEQVYVRIKNEEIRNKAIEILAKNNQNIASENLLKDFKEFPYLKFVSEIKKWTNSDYHNGGIAEISVEKLDEILSQKVYTNQLLLDPNKTYNLVELTSEEKLELGKHTNLYLLDKKGCLVFDNCDKFWYLEVIESKNIVNAKELFYTLENIQVDCRELSESEHKTVFEVFENNNFISLDSVYKSYIKSKKLTHISSNPLNESLDNYVFGYYVYFKNKHTITYDKFMELFGNNEITKTNHEFKVLTKQDIEEGRSNAYEYLEFSEQETRPVEKSILQEAEEIINGSRAEDYGSVTDNFTKIAVGWKEIFADGNFTPRRVAMAMVWLKICRDVNTPKRDNLVDSIGYVACVEKMINEANQ